MIRKPRVLRATRLLAEQTQGIDYASLGLGWSHPRARTEYRSRQHRSFGDARSRARSEASRRKLEALVKSGDVTEQALVATFAHEIGLKPGTPTATNANFEAVLAALEAELLHPLRALNEGGAALYLTFTKHPVPREPVDRIIAEITSHVLQGDFAEWRYSNPVGMRQLEGLSEAQIAKWTEPTRTEHDKGIVVHEDAPGDLGLFWATKIGGPSHGFDLEAQCLLPLLANARHKVVLVSDPSWSAHPAGRAHLRLLWTHVGGDDVTRPLLWLETVNADFAALAAGAVRPDSWLRPVLRHVLSKASSMGIALSLDPGMLGVASEVVRELSANGEVALATKALVLRPSNGVLEASDYLSDKHDWVQMEEEVTQPIRRCMFFPSSRRVDEL